MRILKKSCHVSFYLKNVCRKGILLKNMNLRISLVGFFLENFEY